MPEVLEACYFANGLLNPMLKHDEPIDVAWDGPKYVSLKREMGTEKGAYPV
jgi:hypothetical protein